MILLLSQADFRRISGVGSNPQAPGPEQVKFMGLTGEYVYLLVKPLELKFFLVHLDGSGGDGADWWRIWVLEKAKVGA